MHHAPQCSSAVSKPNPQVWMNLGCHLQHRRNSNFLNNHKVNYSSAENYKMPPIFHIINLRKKVSFNSVNMVHKISLPVYMHTNYFTTVALDTFLIHSPRKHAWRISTVCTRSFKLVQTRTFTLSCPSDCNTSWRACVRKSSSLFSNSNEPIPCNKTRVLKQLEASCNK